MPADPIMLESAIAPALRFAVIDGGSAGNHTVTGVEVGDFLHAVIEFTGGGTDITDLAILTGEFSITAANTINNTGGTDTTGDRLLVIYGKHEVLN